uniref:Glycosylphosphatidylinositol anchor attachment 1 n=1 Tax=Hucho hucho TaxID=62062 RepID=A0A4W5MSZ9_9TELE
MGLLSDPNQRRALTDLLTLCVCNLVGVSWFMGLVLEHFTLPTYMSENAMGSTMVEEHHRGMPVDWLVYTMQSRGLELFTQSFTCKLPFPDENKERYMVHGTNIYGILRGPIAPHTESLVLRETTTTRLGLAQYFRSQITWAKDIFLVNEHDLIGMQAWSRDTTTPTPLGRGGSIQAALSLEQSSDIITSLHLVLDGLNGQLPNLDLIVYLCTIQGKLQRNDWDSTLGYSHAAQTMMVLKQASGRPWGDHSPFLRHHIEAATVRGINTFRQYKTNTTTIGRLLEGKYRKLNNLLERLHQSYFSCPHSLSNITLLVYGSIFYFLLLLLLPSALQPRNPVILTPVVIIHMTGVVLYTLPILSQQMAVQHFPVSETETVVLTAIAIYTAGPPHNTHRQGQGTEQGWRMLKLVALLYLAVLLGCTALINFSLGFIVALSLVPISALINFSLGFIVALSLVPIAALINFSWASSWLYGWMHFLDHALYGSLVYPLLALLIYPCWLLLWNILF